MMRTAAAAAVVGFAFGYGQNLLWGGFYIWIVLYFLGFAVGKVLHKLASHKLGKKVVATILGGLLVGAMLSPARDALLGRNTAAEAMAAFKNDPSNSLTSSAVKAKKHFPKFAQAFKDRGNNKTFSILAPFKEGNAEDHLWLAVDEIDGDKITGRVTGNPILTDVERGDVKSANIQDIEDFRYIDEDGNQQGFYSIRHEVADIAAEYGEEYDSSPQTSSTWMSLLVLAFGLISPVLSVKVRN